MPLVNQQIPGLYNGVSEQAPEVRLDTQVEEMINCHPSVAYGVLKRNPTALVATDNSIPADPFIHVYDRGAGDEQYILVIGDGVWRVYDEEGLLISNGTDSYLDLPEGYAAKDNFAMVTVGDTTFVTNKTKEITHTDTVRYNGDSDWDRTFFYWVKRTNGALDGTNDDLRYTYYIYNNSVQQVENTGEDSTEIATALASGIDGTAVGSVVKKVADVDDIWSGADSWGNQASRSWQGAITKLQDLPDDLGFEDSVIEIAGDEDNNFDSYYVKYEDGVYKETYKPGLSDGVFTATTMPHKFERQEDGTFTLSTIEWKEREVGDDVSASVPSFVGQGIDDVFFFKNRLGFLSGDNVILSEAGEYYNFWPTTVTDVLDSDPIDVAVDSNQAVYLRYAIPFNKELLLFGDKAQFILSSSETLTPKSVSIQQSTSYDFNGKAAPIGIGPNVYFTTTNNSHSIVREYYVVPDTATNDAANITAHCPSYVPKDVFKLTGSGESDMLFALSSEETDTIYVYNFYWQGEEKAQSAWHKWTFDGADIFNIEVLNGNLLVMMNEDDNIKLKVISLEMPSDFTSVTYLEDGVNSYTSDIQLTKWGMPGGQKGVENTRGKLVLRDIKLEMEYGSLYWVESEKNAVPRAYSYITSGGALPSDGLTPGSTVLPGAVTYTMKSDHKYPIAGNVDNTILSIKNDTYAGFKLNSLNLRGMYNIKSRSI